MKIVDERKALADISALKKQNKQYDAIDEMQKQIDDFKEKMREARGDLNSPEQKTLSERYDAITKELAEIKAKQDEEYGQLSSLRDALTKARKERDAARDALKAYKDAFYLNKRAWAAHDKAARDAYYERRRAEQAKYDHERKLERAQRMLDEAREPAFLDEIRRAQSLLRFLDPTTAQEEKAPLLAGGGLAAQPLRTVDDTGIKGTRIVSKKDRDDDFVPAVKKGKKGKKGNNAPAAGETSTSTAKFNCPPSAIADCAAMGINPPMSNSEVPEVIEKIKEKLAYWKEHQAEETEKVR